MKEEITLLQDLHKIMQGDIKVLTADNSLARSSIDTLHKELPERELYEKIEALNMSLTHQQNSEKEIENLVDQLTEKIQQALVQDMTYAQIDDHLTNSLPFECDKIIKDHPALTRNYIRNLRRE